MYARIEEILKGSLRNPQRQRQRETWLNKRFNDMRRTITVHVRYNSWYISLPSCKTTTSNDQILRCLENVNDNG